MGDRLALHECFLLILNLLFERDNIHLRVVLLLVVPVLAVADLLTHGVVPIGLRNTFSI